MFFRGFVYQVFFKLTQSELIIHLDVARKKYIEHLSQLLSERDFNSHLANLISV